MGSWKSLVMKDGETLFEKKAAVDHIPQRRETIAQGIDKQIVNLEDPTNAKRAWFVIKGDIAKLTVRLGARPIPFYEGKFEVYVPVERAKDAYEAMRADVMRGDFDKAIGTLFEGGEDGEHPRKIDGRSTRGELSREAREERYAKMVAKREAKAAAAAAEAAHTKTAKKPKG